MLWLKWWLNSFSRCRDDWATSNSIIQYVQTTVLHTALNHSNACSKSLFITRRRCHPFVVLITSPILCVIVIRIFITIINVNPSFNTLYGFSLSLLTFDNVGLDLDRHFYTPQNHFLFARRRNVKLVFYVIYGCDFLFALK